jgi:thymidylate synthase
MKIQDQNIKMEHQHNQDLLLKVWEEYDISKGEFPIPTLRNTAIKTGIKEILWIYQKQTSFT